MSNAKQWTTRVFVSRPSVPGRPIPQAVEVTSRAFRIPGSCGVDRAREQARSRVNLDGFKLRAVSVAAPLSERTLLVYLEERSST